MSQYEEKLKLENKKAKKMFSIIFGFIGTIVLLWQLGGGEDPCVKHNFQLSILIDDTAPLNKIATKKISEDIKNLMHQYEKQNVMLNLFRLSNFASNNDKPDSVCVPKECTSTDSALKGCKSLQDAQKAFDKILKATMNESLTHHASLSPIAEGIINIQGGAYLNSPSSKNSALYIYSDMLQNSAATNFFAGTTNFDYSRIHKPVLATDSVHICLIQRTKNLAMQTRVIPAWKKFFGESHTIWDSKCTILVK